jgi:hypothetical protein
MRRCLCRCNGIALGLDRLDHLKDKLQALQFALDFLLESPWQLISSSSAQAFQPQHSLRVHRLVVVDAMDGAKALDACWPRSLMRRSRSRCSRRSSSSATLGHAPRSPPWVPHAHAPSVTAAVARRRCDPSSLVVHVGRLASSPDRLRNCALSDLRANGAARSRHNWPHSTKSFLLTGQIPETRLRIRSINSGRPLQSQPSNVYRLILSKSGVCTATIQLVLLNSIAKRQRTTS